MKKIILSLVLVLASVFSVSTPAFAADWNEICGSLTPGSVQYEAAGCGITSGSAAETELNNTIKNVINVALGMIGVLAVIVIIIAGILMATANGDVAKVAKARNAIMYSLIGLAIALSAFAIVNFVLGAF